MSETGFDVEIAGGAEEPLETRAARFHFDKHGVSAEFLGPEEHTVRELRHSDVPPEHWPVIIVAGKRKRKRRKPWHRRAASWLLRLLAILKS